jgi:hypothetical protein
VRTWRQQRPQALAGSPGSRGQPGERPGGPRWPRQGGDCQHVAAGRGGAAAAAGEAQAAAGLGCLCLLSLSSDSFCRYDIKAPSMFTTRNVGKTLVTRTAGTKVRRGAVAAAGAY